MGLNLVKIDCEVNVASCELPPKCPPCTLYPLKKWWDWIIKNMGNGDRGFAFTYYCSEDLLGSLIEKSKYLVIGRETCPDTGRLHLQGYVYFKEKKSFNAVRALLPGIATDALKVAGGSARQNAAYCKKGDQSKEEWLSLKEDGPNYGLNVDYVEYGERPLDKNERMGKMRDTKKKRNELYMSKSILELVEEGEISLNQVPLIKKAKMIIEAERPPVGADDVRGVWIYGPPGVGKSRRVREMHEDLYLKAQNKWWDGYAGQSYVLLDDLDKQGVCLSHYLKIWADRYACTGEVKNYHANLRYKKFYVTSNYSIEELFGEDDVLCRAIRRRFDVIHMLDLVNV